MENFMYIQKWKENSIMNFHAGFNQIQHVLVKSLNLISSIPKPNYFYTNPQKKRTPKKTLIITTKTIIIILP